MSFDASLKSFMHPQRTVGHFQDRHAGPQTHPEELKIGTARPNVFAKLFEHLGKLTGSRARSSLVLRSRLLFRTTARDSGIIDYFFNFQSLPKLRMTLLLFLNLCHHRKFI